MIDEWLDDESEAGDRAGAARKKRSSAKHGAKDAKAALSDSASANAVVSEVFPNRCRVSLDQGGEEILCTYRRARFLLSEEASRERTPVAVGDRVRVERLNPQSGVVEAVAPRRNFLARPAPGRDDPNLFHVIAANIDLLVIVASVAQPGFSPGLVDRYLIASLAAGIPRLLCVTKSDLLSPEAAGAAGPWDAYHEAGQEWILVSARTGSGIDELKSRICGKSVVFCGHSGVGKTSLFRAITGKELGKIGEVNLQTGKGRHTTTSAVLYRDPSSGSDWIDTPGVREFGLVGVTPDNLAGYFPEFLPLECTGRGCRHLGEPGCQATGLFRYASYRRIHESLL